MRYVIIRCEDTAPMRHRRAALLEGAKVSYLNQLAQAGAVGTIQSEQPGLPVDSFRLDCGLLGLNPDAPENAPGLGAVANAGVSRAEGETAWCCEFVTHQDGRIADATAGNIPTAESRLLIQALNETLGSDARRWCVGESSHHVLLARDPALMAEGGSLRAPQVLVGQPWTPHLPSGAQGVALKALLEQATQVLEAHPVNRVRLDLGENPANMLWLWGPASGAGRATYAELTGRTGAVCSSAFHLRGIAQAVRMTVQATPSSWEEPSLQRLGHTASDLLQRHEVVFVQLQVASTDPLERFCAMERVDQAFLKPLASALSNAGAWRLLVAVDDTIKNRVPCVAIGTGLPQQPATDLDAERVGKSPLAFTDGTEAFAWFTTAH